MEDGVLEKAKEWKLRSVEKDRVTATELLLRDFVGYVYVVQANRLITYHKLRHATTACIPTARKLNGVGKPEMRGVCPFPTGASPTWFIPASPITRHQNSLKVVGSTRLTLPTKLPLPQHTTKHHATCTAACAFSDGEAREE
eukprot:2794697-Rhodomonas_salina.1